MPLLGFVLTGSLGLGAVVAGGDADEAGFVSLFGAFSLVFLHPI